MRAPDPAAVIVTEAMLALGRRGHDAIITNQNGPRLMRLAGLMLAEFGVDECAASGDGDDQALVTQ